MKKCSKCFIEKELVLFSKAKNKKYGIRSQCKDCDKLYRKSINSNKVSEYRKEYYLKNKDYLLSYNKKYNLENSEYIKANKKKNRNVEAIKIISDKYYIKNKVLLNEKSKAYQQKNKVDLREKARLRLIEKRSKDPVFKLKCNIRRLIQLSLKSKGYIKDSKTFEVLGCTADEFKNYLESKFEDWMNWDNRGLFNSSFNYGWDLDHIIPLKTAVTKEDVIKLNHYTNFQPLCGKINREIKNGNY